jgi:phosphinothricin acetyltransferase
MSSYIIRTVTPEDASQICDIYNYYIENTCITFEEEPVLVDEMQLRINDTLHEYAWIVYEEEGKILGYAYFSKWKVRTAYRYCAESTVYLRYNCMGKGIGTILYTRIIDMARKKKLHSLLGGITIPNEPSIKLHEKLGFEKVAQLREVGFKHNKWLDVGYWELIL